MRTFSILLRGQIYFKLGKFNGVITKALGHKKPTVGSQLVLAIKIHFIVK